MSRRTPSNYLTPTSGRPTRETISSALGFKVPLRFAEFVCQVYDLVGGNYEKGIEAFDAALGICPGGPDDRYLGTPPELFPIGRTGCDGDHYGFLVHAPELNLDDLPYCHYCPMDPDGVLLEGSTTVRGIAATMARLLSYDFVDATQKSLIADVAASCMIRPRPELDPRIAVPIGWRYQPSSDGVGTLAPSELFSPRNVVKYDEYGSIEPFVEAADEAARSKFPATALHYLREGLWFFWVTKPYALGERMAEIYKILNRGLLADEIDRTMDRWRQSPDV